MRGVRWHGAALAVLLVAGATGTAAASSGAAWQALFETAARACIAASGLADARAVGTPAQFSDRLLLVIEGRWPQPHMQDRRGTFACLYDQQADAAEAQEMPAER